MTADTENGPGSGQPRRADAYDLGFDPSDEVADEWPVAADTEPQGYMYDDTQDIVGPAVGPNELADGPEFTVPRDAPPWGDPVPWEDESAFHEPPAWGVRPGPRSRAAGLTVLMAGVAVVVIAVGVGAAIKLTGKTQGKAMTPPGQAGTAGTARGSGALGAGAPGMAVSAAALPGYPGRGVTGELVEGLASADGAQLAVGTVDGLPAVWRRAGNGPWSLVTQNTAGITGRAAVLTNIHLSPRGWIATGVLGSGSASHPVVLVSADGRTWQVVDGEPSFGGPGGYSYAIAAGKSEDVVVGKVVNGGRTAAATWWSTDLHHWVRGGNNGGLDGRLKPSQMNAATVTPQKFVAVGQHGGLPAVWLASVARDWTVTDLPMPAGATSAALTKVAATGDRIVALGDKTTPGGTVPFAVTSADGGATWREVPIAAPSGGTATVTAVTVSASGFTAVAQASGTNAIYWKSADGTAWSAPRQADPGITAITGLIPAGATVTGIGQSPAGLPVIWAAR